MGTYKGKPGPLCSECPLRDKPGPVWGEGPPNAKLVAIGQNPGPEEIGKGRPFIGGAGRILNKGFYKVGIDRSEIFITNAVKCFVPPKVEVPYKAIQCCRPLLDRELDILQFAKTYLTLGGPAFQTFTGKDLSSVTNKKKKTAWLRGCPYHFGSKTIVPALHPIFIAYSGFRAEPYFLQDLLKAKRFSEGRGVKVTEHLNYNPTPKEVSEYVLECLHEGHFGVDIETPEKIVQEEEELAVFSDHTDIEVVGIAARIGEAMGVPPDLFPLLKPLFNPETETQAVAFNWGFDGYHLATRFKLGPKLIPADLMLALNHLYPDIRPKDLGVALSLFTDMPYHKNLMKTQPKEYNARDTYGALWGMQNARLEMAEYGKLVNLFWAASMPLIPVVTQMRVTGANCDLIEATRQELTCSRTLEAYQKAWRQLVPFVEWSSPKQLLGLFRKMGLPIITERRGKGPPTPTTNDKALEKYVTQYGNKTAALVLEMRKLKKAIDFTHVYHADGRAHVKYKIHGQKQGRLQAKDPDLQNIPEEMAEIRKGKRIVLTEPRKIIIPDNPDHLILHADFEQIELWCYAYACQDPKLLEIKRRAEYVYGIFYEEIFHEPFFLEGHPRIKPYRRKDVPPEKLLIAKSGPLGFIYGRGADSLMYPPMSLPKKDAFRVYDQFHNDHPKVGEYHRRIINEAREKGYLQNFFGRIRRFPHVDIMRNELLSFPGQSNGADVLIQNALLPLHEGLPDYGARLMFTVHDSVTVSCPKTTALGCAQFMRDCMEKPVPQMNNFWFSIALYIGPNNWGELTPYEEWTQAEQRTVRGTQAGVGGAAAK